MEREIPIRNLYYLLTYAWDHFRAGEETCLGVENCPDFANLLARVLANGIWRLARDGLDREYLSEVAEVSRLRGRIHLLQSVRRLAHLRGRMECEFDELKHDVLHNQILRSTATRLLCHAGLENEVSHELRSACRTLEGVHCIRLTAGVFSRVRLHRNNRRYLFLMHLCALIFHHLLPDEESGSRKLQEIQRDDIVMHRLFEDFVFNFARRNARETRVDRFKIDWDATGHDTSLRLLPEMRTDITMESGTERKIVDCKFYRRALRSRFEASSPKLHSANLYQMMTYLKNQSRKSGWEDVKGLLLYPVVDEVPKASLRVMGHDLEIAGVNLDQPWKCIHQELVDILALS